MLSSTENLSKINKYFNDQIHIWETLKRRLIVLKSEGDQHAIDYVQSTIDRIWFDIQDRMDFALQFDLITTKEMIEYIERIDARINYWWYFPKEMDDDD